MIRSLAKRLLTSDYIAETRRTLRISSSLRIPRRVIPSVRKSDIAVDSALGSKYKIFQDFGSPIIRDTDEELNAATAEELIEELDEFDGLNLNRGVHGVFDIEDLVDVLKRENAKNIVVCAVPDELVFVDHICIVTGRSTRHMIALAEFIRKLYKRKKNPDESIPRIEGITSKEWIAMDLGNIAFHIFNENSRKVYDLDQLWSVGPNYDYECSKSNSDIIALLEKHSVRSLDDLYPAENEKE